MDPLEQELVKIELTRQESKTYFVLYLDMLGFSALTAAHPATITIQTNDED